MDSKSDVTTGPDGAASTRAPSPVVTVGDTLQVVPAATVAAESQAWAGFDDDSPLPPRRPRVFTPVTWALAAGLLAVGGFALGAKVGRASAPKATASAAAAGFGQQRAAAGAPTTVAGRAATGTTVAGAAAGTGRTGGTGTGGFGGAGGGTFGTVKLIDGTAVYIQDASGNVIKVTTSADSAISVTKRGTAADLKAGDTVIVQGATDDAGNIAATAITSTGGLAAGRGQGQGQGQGQTGQAQTPAAAGPTTTTRG